MALIRQVALSIKDLQSDVSKFARALRLKNFLNELGLNEEKIESLIAVAEVHCFKRGFKLEEFFEMVEGVISYSDKVGIPLEDLLDHIGEQKRILEDLYSEIEDAKNNLSVVLRNNDVTLSDFENYKKDMPLISTLEETRLELDKATKDRDAVTKDRDGLWEQINKERIANITRKHEWMVTEHELEEANEQLVNNKDSSPLSFDELYRLANSLFRQPSRYVDFIEILRERNLKLRKEKSS